MLTSIKRQSPFGSVVFCDDIRQEVGNKLSLMGVYFGDLYFPTPFPNSLPKLCASISYMERPGESTEPVKIILLGPTSDEDGPLFENDLPMDEVRAIKMPTDPEADDPFCFAQINISIASLLIKKEGRITVWAVRGDMKLRLGSLLIGYSDTMPGVAA